MPPFGSFNPICTLYRSLSAIFSTFKSAVTACWITLTVINHRCGSGFHDMTQLGYSLACLSHTRAWEIGELNVGVGTWLVLGSIKVPVLIYEVLLIRSEFGMAGIVANRAVILIHAILGAVGCCWRWLLLGWAEAISWLREGTLSGWAHRGWIQAWSSEVVGMVTTGSRSLSLPTKVSIKCAKVFAHRKGRSVSINTEGVRFWIAFRPREIFCFLL